jgi:hypothetical protein
MNRRSIILTLGLLISAYLVIFGEKPDSGVSEPVVRNKANNRADSRASHPGNASSSVVTSKTFNRDGEGSASASRQENKPENKQEHKSGNKKASASTQVLTLLPRDTLIDEAPDVSAKPAKPGKPNKPGGTIAGLQPTNNIPREALFDSQTWDPPPPPPPKPGPPPPPVAPPLPYVVIGKKLEDLAWEVYLTRGEQTFIAREKLVLEGQYRVDSIKPPTMTLTYLPLNQTQTLTIGGND